MSLIYRRVDRLGREVRLGKHSLRKEWYVYVGNKLAMVADNIGDAYRLYNRVDRVERMVGV